MATDRRGATPSTEAFAPTHHRPNQNPAGFEGEEIGGRLSRDADDISLVDLWLLLVRRRAIVGATLTICLLGGLAFAFLQDPRYVFQTTVEIGTIDAPLDSSVATSARNRGETLLQPPETVAAKLKEAYIPTVLSEQFGRERNQAVPKVAVESPTGSQLMLIRSEGPRSDAERHLGLHQEIVAALLADHEVLMRNYGESINLKISDAQRRYDSLSDQERLLAGRLEHLETEKALLQKQIGEVRELLSNAASELERARSEGGEEARALTILMVGNEIQQNRDRMAELEERLQIGLPQQRQDLEKQLADVKRDKAGMEEEITALETRLRSLRPTRVIAGPARSLEPVGPGRAVVVALAAVLGLVLGVFATFFAEFLKKVGEVRSGAADHGHR